MSYYNIYRWYNLQNFCKVVDCHDFTRAEAAQCNPASPRGVVLKAQGDFNSSWCSKEITGSERYNYSPFLLRISTSTVRKMGRWSWRQSDQWGIQKKIVALQNTSTVRSTGTALVSITNSRTLQAPIHDLVSSSNGSTGNYLSSTKSTSPFIEPIPPFTSVPSLKTWSSSHIFCIGPGGALSCAWLVSLCCQDLCNPIFFWILEKRLPRFKSRKAPHQHWMCCVSDEQDL